MAHMTRKGVAVMIKRPFTAAASGLYEPRNNMKPETYNLDISGWPVPTNLFCKCSQFLENDILTLKRSEEACSTER